MLRETLIKLFDRDLGRLRTEIESYRNESNLWRVDGEITNSAGNLCLHLVGNLNTYLGAELGASGYVRDRDREFSEKSVPRTELLTRIDETRETVARVLENLPEESFANEYPQIVFDAPMTTGYFLIHLTTHLTWPLGQINYHRRLLDR